MNMRFENLKQELAARHRQALCADIRNLTAVIALFKGKKVTVWHCCDRDGSGYYTVSDGKIKRFVHSEYRLECVGGCWSIYVYERLYLAQIYLEKFLKAVKAEICRRCSAVMPIKSLYIEYIINGLYDKLCDDETKEQNYKTALEHQQNFIKKRSAEIEKYNKVVENGYDYFGYYNGCNNFEFSYISEVIDNAVNEIYAKREALEACKLWSKARSTVDELINLKNLKKKD